MGSNMQRQAVPLISPEPPRVGTGMEGRTAYDSGVVVIARRAGVVSYVTSIEIRIKPDEAKREEDIYPLLKYQRTNQDTCYTQKPIVLPDQKIAAGDVIADGPATYQGELALGRNLLCAFMPWNGYNYEDAILISEKVVQDDAFSSIHIKEFSVEVRETKLGPEKITRDIPNTNEHAFEQLDEEGIIRVGASVKAGSILVGKVTPKSETDSTPEFKLLNSIFGEKAKEVRDTSLRVPHGVEGTIIDVQRLKRTNGDELDPGRGRGGQGPDRRQAQAAGRRQAGRPARQQGRRGPRPPHGRDAVHGGRDAHRHRPQPAGRPVAHEPRPDHGDRAGLGGHGAGRVVLDPRVPVRVQRDDRGEAQGSQSSPHVQGDPASTGTRGEPFENQVMVGTIYILKLHHLVDDKMHARSTGPYSLVTQQPLGGKAQFGGQRLGEMEVWALEAYGASNTLQELLTIKSDDMMGRAKIYESIVKGEVSTAPDIPESFNVLVQEMRGLALDVSIFDLKNKQIALTERDEELIDRQMSRF